MIDNYHISNNEQVKLYAIRHFDLWQTGTRLMPFSLLTGALFDCNILLQAACRFIGNRAFKSDAKLRINVAFSRFALILNTQETSYFCYTLGGGAEVYNTFFKGKDILAKRTVFFIV